MSRKKVDPITPDEVGANKVANFPNEVFEAFNDLITAKFAGGVATLKQDEVVELLVNKDLDRVEIFEKGWLNVEEAYRKAGWKVVYDKPGFSETYPATFTFSRGK